MSKNNIILYSNNCPRCMVLKDKLDKANIDYIINNNIDELINMGIQTVPVLKINDKILDFATAMKYVTMIEKASKGE